MTRKIGTTGTARTKGTSKNRKGCSRLYLRIFHSRAKSEECGGEDVTGEDVTGEDVTLNLIIVIADFRLPSHTQLKFPTLKTNSYTDLEHGHDLT